MAATVPFEAVSFSLPNAPAFRVLNVRVNAVQIDDVIRYMESWILERDTGHYIAVTGMHGVIEALHNPQFNDVLNGASLVVPDGYPLVLMARRRGFLLKRRVYGPELMDTFCARTAYKGYRHFFYGGANGVADELATTLAARYPGMKIAGTYCPPFRRLSPSEDREICNLVSSSNADIVWVGISTPKQERWMAEHCHKLNLPVLVGVGAAFDFNTGRITQAPIWMRENGLEWLFRLVREPRRLWRRYLIGGAQFVFNVTLEELGLRKFE